MADEKVPHLEESMTTEATAPAAKPQPYRILIAVAFDSTSEPALIQGISLACGHPGSELHVVHVAGEPGPLDGTNTLLKPTADGPEDPAEILRRRIERGWQQAGELRVIAHIRSGNPAQMILQAAIDIGADIVVVGTHHRSGLKKLVLGSVAEQVLHGAHCPVLVVMAKDYAGTVPSPSVAPPCPDCVALRQATANASFWCERHSKPYMQPHIYVPRDQARSSVLPTY
jgi:nucleotide-binding universal stress UspA family protein